MTLFVTGGGGFVMSHVVRHWLERHPEERAVALDRWPLDGQARRFFQPVADRLRFLQADVAALDDWSPALTGEEITAVVHGAAVTSINRLTAEGLLGAQAAVEANIMGSFRVLAWAGSLPRLNCFINVSSGSVYADEGPEAPLPEDGFVEPEGLYPITKHVGELLTRQAAAQFGLPAASVRLSGVYGPMDRQTASRDVICLPQQLARLALSGETVRVNSLAAVGDFLHAADVAAAICALLEAPRRRHAVYNIAYGATATVEELLEGFAAKLPGLRFEEVGEDQANVLVEPEKRSGRWGAYDISRIVDDTGWRPRPLYDALADYLDWLRKETAGEP